MRTRNRYRGSRADVGAPNNSHVGQRSLPLLDSVDSSESMIKNDRLSKHTQLIRTLSPECSDQMLAKLSELEASFRSSGIFEDVLRRMVSCKRSGLIVSEQDVILLSEELLYLGSLVEERNEAIDVMLETFVRCLASYGRARVLRPGDLTDMAKMHDMLLKNHFSVEDIVDLYVELRPYSKKQIMEFGDIDRFASVIVSLIDESVGYSHGPLSCLYFILNCAEGGSLRLNSDTAVSEFGKVFNNTCRGLKEIGIDQKHDSKFYELLIDCLYSCALEGVVKTLFDVALITRFIVEASRAHDRDYYATLGLDKPAHTSMDTLSERVSIGEEDSDVPDADYYNPWTFGWLMDAFYYMRQDGWVSSKNDVKVLTKFIEKVLEHQFTEVLEDRQ